MTAKKNKKNGKKGKALGPSKFQAFGKYFLILLIFVGQAFLAYAIVDKNYEQTYRYLQQFNSSEAGNYTFEELIVNPAGTNGQRYLLVELTLETVDIDHIELLEKNSSKIRHDLIEFLSSQTVDKLEGLKEKEDLRVSLVKIINNAIGLRSVRNLYYTKYVMQ